MTMILEKRMLERLGWTLADLVAWTRMHEPVEIESATLRCKKMRPVPDGTDLFAPNEDIVESYETSMVNPGEFLRPKVRSAPAIIQTDDLLCKIVVEPVGATLELILDAVRMPVRTLKGVEHPSGKPMVFTPEDVAKAAPGVWIERGVSVQAKIKGCNRPLATVRLFGWEVPGKGVRRAYPGR